MKYTRTTPKIYCSVLLQIFQNFKTIEWIETEDIFIITGKNFFSKKLFQLFQLHNFFLNWIDLRKIQFWKGAMKRAASCRSRKRQLFSRSTLTTPLFSTGRRWLRKLFGYIFYLTIGHEKCRWCRPLLFSRSTSTILLFSTWLMLTILLFFTWSTVDPRRLQFYSAFHHALLKLLTRNFMKSGF